MTHTELDSHQRWLDRAERIDSLRVFPRLFLIACFWFMVDVTFKELNWYMHLTAAERGLETSGFAAAALLGIMTFVKMVFADYSSNGRDWSQRPPMTSTLTTRSTTVTGVTP